MEVHHTYKEHPRDISRCHENSHRMFTVRSWPVLVDILETSERYPKGVMKLRSQDVLKRYL